MMKFEEFLLEAADTNSFQALAGDVVTQIQTFLDKYDTVSVEDKPTAIKQLLERLRKLQLIQPKEVKPKLNKQLLNLGGSLVELVTSDDQETALQNAKDWLGVVTTKLQDLSIDLSGTSEE